MTATSCKRGKRAFCLLFSILFCLLLFLQTGPFTVWAAELPAFSGGAGTSTDPYLITSEADLRALSEAVKNDTAEGITKNKYFKLTQDITLTQEFPPIGGYASGYGFQGDFDGAGHTITVQAGFVDETEPNEYGELPMYGLKYHGVFGRANGAVIHDLNVKADSLTMRTSYIYERAAHHYIGAVVGFAENGAKIERCSFEGNIILNFVGQGMGTPPGSPSGPGQTPPVEEIAYAGGVIGCLSDSTANSCYSIIGTLTLQNNDLDTGFPDSAVPDSPPYFGGVVGYIAGNAEEKLSYCYNSISEVVYQGDWMISGFRPSGIVGLFEEIPANGTPAELYHSYYSASPKITDNTTWYDMDLIPAEGDILIFSKNFPEGSQTGEHTDAAVTSRTDEGMAQNDVFTRLLNALQSAGANYRLDETGKPVPVREEASYSFLLTIPASASIDVTTGEGTVEITASEVQLEDGQAVTVNIQQPTGADYFSLKHSGNGGDIRYDVYRADGSKYDFDTPLCTFTTEREETVTYRLQENNSLFAGSYTGTLNYVVGVAEE